MVERTLPFEMIAKKPSSKRWLSALYAAQTRITLATSHIYATVTWMDKTITLLPCTERTTSYRGGKVTTQPLRLRVMVLHSLRAVSIHHDTQVVFTDTTAKPWVTTLTSVLSRII